MGDGTIYVEVIWQAQNIASSPINYPGVNKYLSDDQGHLFKPNDGSDASPILLPGMLTNDLKESYTIPAGLESNLYWGRRSDFFEGLEFRIKLKPM